MEDRRLLYKTPVYGLLNSKRIISEHFFKLMATMASVTEREKRPSMYMGKIV